MAKKEEQPERRRFDEKDRKAWSEDDRKKFLGIASGLAPFVKHLTTPAKEEKKESDFDGFIRSLFK